MSKKNKALKQLIRAQVQAGLQGETEKTVQKTESSIEQQKTGEIPVVSNGVTEKVNQEYTIIGRDIQITLILTFSIILTLLVIYFLDRQYGFLLETANAVFRFMGLS